MKRFLALALFGLAASAPVTDIPAAAQSATAAETVAFAVDNMTCALCPVTVKRAMEGVDGVRARGIDFEPRTATFVFDDTATNANAIAAASADAGYPARIGG